MMPLGAPSISKYGSLVRPDAQIVALRAHCALHCARTALEAPPNHTSPECCFEVTAQGGYRMFHGPPGSALHPPSGAG